MPSLHSPFSKARPARPSAALARSIDMPIATSVLTRVASTGGARRSTRRARSRWATIAPMFDEWVLRRRRVVDGGTVGPADIAIRGGTIVAVGASAPAGPPVVDVGDLAVIPGVVDSHVHVNEPGRTEWEGFASATRAAAAGGVTTI